MLLGAAAISGWMPPYEELEGKQTRNKRCARNTRQKAQAINLDLHIQQLKKLGSSLAPCCASCPAKRDGRFAFPDINQAGLGRGLQFELFKPSQERLQDFYAELPVDVRVTGNYHDIGAFASDVSQLSRIVTLNDIAITNKDPKDMVLTMEAMAKTFRYLDDEEVAAQRKTKRMRRRRRRNECSLAYPGRAQRSSCYSPAAAVAKTMTFEHG